MTWKKSLWLSSAIMLAMLLIVGLIVSRLRIPGSAMRIMGVSSIFPAGGNSRVMDAKNNWQGFAFAGNFRFFSRPAPQAGEDLKRLVKENFSASPLKQELDLFEGGVYVLQRAGKGYRMFCIFCRSGMNYWADMRSRDSLHFSRLVFERFILNLEIAGEKPAATVAGQVAALRRRTSPLVVQTPGMLLGMMAGIFALVMMVMTVVMRFSGSCPRRAELAEGACTPYATLRSGGFGRRKITACCLCREGEFLVIYRFRRPYKKIVIAAARQEIIWETSSFRYQNLRIILPYNEFQRWRAILMA